MTECEANVSEVPLKDEKLVNCVFIKEETEMSTVPVHSRNKRNVTKAFKCSHCDFSTNIKWDLKVHELNHLETKHLKCLKCDYAIGLKNMKKHVQMHLNAVTPNIAEDVGLVFNKSESDELEEVLFKCSKCNYTTDFKSILTKHKSTRVPAVKPKKKVKYSIEAIYNCSKCNYAGHTSALLKRHELSHLENKKLKCSKCNYSTNFNSYMKEHEMTHLNVRPFKCSKCKFASKLKSNLKKHEALHLERSLKPKKYRRLTKLEKCYKCDYTTMFKSLLQKHEVSHLKITLFKCFHCSFVTHSRSLLRKHEKIHMKLILFNCTKCNYATNEKNLMEEHEQSHLEDFQSSRYFEGGVASVDDELSDQHELSHSKTEKMKCSIPTKGFLEESKLTNSETNILKCSSCDYTTSTKRYMTKHKFTHLQDKALKCSKCDFSSNTQRFMEKHEESHSETSSFKCLKREGYLKAKSITIKALDTAVTDVLNMQCPMEKHEEESLSEISSFKCLKSEDYSKAAGIKIKEELDTSDIDVLKCCKCDYVTNDEELMDKHELGHSEMENKSWKSPKSNFELNENNDFIKEEWDYILNVSDDRVEDEIAHSQGDCLENLECNEKFEINFKNNTLQKRIVHSSDTKMSLERVGSDNAETKNFKCTECDFVTDLKCHMTHELDYSENELLKCCQHDYGTKSKCNMSEHESENSETNYVQSSTNPAVRCDLKYSESPNFECCKCDHTENIKVEMNIPQNELYKCWNCEIQDENKKNCIENFALNPSKNLLFFPPDHEPATKVNLTENHEFIKTENESLDLSELDCTTNAKSQRNYEKFNISNSEVAHVSSTQQTMQTIELMHVPRQILKCSMCNYNTAKKCLMRKHEFRHSQSNNVKTRKHDNMNAEIHEEKQGLNHSKSRHFKCSTCHYSSKHQSIMRKHELIHLETKSLKCSECTYATNAERNFKQHLKVHSKKTKSRKSKQENNAYTNYILRESVANLDNYFKDTVKHVLNPSEAKICDTFERNFINGGKNPAVKDELIQSENKTLKSSQPTDVAYIGNNLEEENKVIHTEINSFSCSECNYLTTAKKLMEKHRLSHLKCKIFKRKKCHNSTKDQGRLRDHELIHLETKNLKCSHCSYATNLKRNLKQHEKVHPKKNSLNSKLSSDKQLDNLQTETINCKKCEFTTDTEILSKKHLSHLESKKYKGSEINSSKNFRGHMDKQHLNANAKKCELKETQTKIFKCSKCDYAAHRRRLLKGHELIHLKVKKLKCSKCSYATNLRRNLRQHEIIHFEIKRFKCSSCSYATHHKASFKKHVLSKHKKSSENV